MGAGGVLAAAWWNRCRRGPVLRHLARAMSLLMLAGSVPAGAAAAHRITVVTSRDIAPYRAAQDGFVEALERSGTAYRITEIRAEGDDRMSHRVVQEIRNSHPDLILTIGSAATRAVGHDIRDIPIIFSLVLEDDPREESDDLGTNVTGASMHIPLRVQFEKLHEAIPQAHRVGVMFNPAETGARVEEARREAEKAGMQLVPVPVHNQADVLTELEKLDGKVDLLWSVPDATVFTPQSVRHILLSTLRKKIPFIGLSPSYVRAGALLSLSCDYHDVGRQSGELAVEVLLGSQPSNVPITVPRTVSYYINMNTARQLEIKISEKVKEAAEVVSGS